MKKMKIFTFSDIIYRKTILFMIGLIFLTSWCVCDSSKDKVAHTVINELHSELDDNNDGEVDANEAEEFAQDELKYKPSTIRSELFKNHITKDKLWQSWKTSEAYNWSVEDVIVWLTVHIDLPEYTQVFIANNISGNLIPRLALSDMTYLLSNLRIINPDHRKRIALNAKELILFGIPKDVECKFSKDKIAFEVIKQLHAQLDDDQDGGVDPQEADEYARDELQYTSDFERAKGLNKNDDHISKEELWRNWKASEVFNWTIPDVLEWLISNVELSEYADAFTSNQINGSLIPRLALSDMSFLIKELKIKNPVHRKKILLKATDLILFGAPKKHHSKMKDTILLTLIIFTIGGCWLAFSQHRYSKSQLKNMQEKMNQLGKAEESLCKLQNKLEEAEMQNNRVTSEKLEMEEKLKFEIEKFKEEIIRTDSSEDLFKSRQSDDHLFNQLNLDQNFSQNLKILLQMTYEVENYFFSVKRLQAEQQMRNVREMCEKLRKKKSTFIGSLKMAHSGNLDDMDKQLSEAKHAVDEVRNDLTERSQRWECFEKLVRFKIFPTPGLSALRASFKFNNSAVMPRQHICTPREFSTNSLESLLEIESIHDLTVKCVEDTKPLNNAVMRGPESLPIYSAKVTKSVEMNKFHSEPQFLLNSDEFERTLIPTNEKRCREHTDCVTSALTNETTVSCKEGLSGSTSSLCSTNTARISEKQKFDRSPNLLRKNKNSFGKLFQKKESSNLLNLK